MSRPPGFCRDCEGCVAADDPTCPSCGSRRAARHGEIGTLSLAHLDCDAFYASIEKRDDPKLEDQPVVVGGGRRGVVSAACYVARLYGVRSAMPMFKALKACPDAVVVRPRMEVYAAEGRRIREMMRDVTPLVEPLSIDEAFMDLSGTERLHAAAPAATLIGLQNRIKAQVGVTASIGLSYNKFLAKTASDLDKPDGFAVLGRGDAPAFLAARPVEAVYGVGPAFARKLRADGLSTLAQVRRRGDAAMMKRYGEAGLRLYKLAGGEDERSVNPERARKSVSAETTFESDIADRSELEAVLWRLSVKVADRMKAESVSGRVVVLKLKRADFRTLTRRRTLLQPSQLADTLFQTVRDLLAEEPDGVRYRLVGAGYGELQPESGDLGDLLDPDGLRRAAAERAMDAARAKFGSDAVIKGRALGRGGR